MNKSRIIAFGLAIAALFVAIVIANAYSTPSTAQAKSPVDIEEQGDNQDDAFDSESSSIDFDREDELLDSIDKLNGNIKLLVIALDSVEAKQNALVAGKDRQITRLNAEVARLNAKVKTLEQTPKSPPARSAASSSN
ncbi:MAG: hypothetical protein IJ724_02875 [Muribaculaceae bacterium]|nr:hypothetical protein [Muribaculaceae bacterium]